jgi:ubiquitin-like-conjugating enzyme ATG10
MAEYHVVYSVSYSVPVLYFNLWSECDTAAAAAVIPRSRIPGGGLSTKALLSQGEHPVLGTPFWFLHPCGTAAFMAELFAAGAKRDRYLATWLSWASQLIGASFPVNLQSFCTS